MSNMQTAYQLAAYAVKQRLEEQQPDFLQTLLTLEKTDVVVYKGTYDSVQNVLDCLQVPYLLDLSPQATKYKARIVFLNCASTYNENLIKFLPEYVAKGAYLVSSDWALPALRKMFPNTVARGKKNSGDEVISVEPYLDSLWSDIVVLGADPQWWLETSSYPIEILDKERVKIEAASHDLLVRYGKPAVAIRFEWQKGHVFHVMSHFWHKRSRTPTSRHKGPGVDFLRAGMRLSEEGIEKTLKQAKAKPDTINFATLQSCATATELVTQLCVYAKTQNRIS